MTIEEQYAEMKRTRSWVGTVAIGLQYLGKAGVRGPIWDTRPVVFVDLRSFIGKWKSDEAEESWKRATTPPPTDPKRCTARHPYGGQCRREPEHEGNHRR